MMSSSRNSFERRRASRVALLVATLLFSTPAVSIPGGAALRAQDAPRPLAGQVRDARTGEPLAAVHVSSAGRAVLTGADGRFVLPLVPPGAVVRFERIGYGSRDLEASAIGEVVELVATPVLLDAVVVGAARPNTIAAGTALAVGSIGNERIAGGAHTSVAEAMRGAEGVSIARMGAWGGRAFLRGLGQERVAVLIDGMQVHRACSGGMDQGVATIDPATVERIEILSGPGSALYGSGNIGGVINVVTRRAAHDAPFTGEVRASAATAAPGGTLGGTAGLRLGDFDASLSLDATKHGDYRSPEGRVEGSSFRHGTADLRLGWDLMPAQRLAFQAQLYEGRDIGWPAMGPDSKIPTERRRSFALDYGAQLGKGMLDGVAARAYLQRLDHEMLVAMPAGTMGQESHSTVTGGRVQLRLLPAEGAHIDLGSDIKNWAAENTRWNDPRSENRMTFHTWPNVDITDVGLFSQGEFRLGGGFTLSAGGRVDRVVRSADGWETTKEWVGTGNAGLRWTHASGLGARVSVGRGFRNPDPSELFGLAMIGGKIYRGNPELETETSRNIEASLTYDIAGLSASVTGFRNDLSRLISAVLAPDTYLPGIETLTYINLNEARLDGVSASFHWDPVSRLALTGTMTYTRGKDRGTGRPIAGIPPLEAGLTARLSGDAGRWLELETQVAARQARYVAEAGEVETPGYGVVNARVGFEAAGMTMIAGVDNLFDRAYRGHLDPVTLLRPKRGFYLKVSRAFGMGGE